MRPDMPSRLENHLDAFDAAWQQLVPPRLEDFLPAGSDPKRREVLVGLVRIDLERRIKGGEPARVESYLDRFPELRDGDGVLLELVLLENDLRRRHDPATNSEEYLARFPELAPQLPTRSQTMIAADDEPRRACSPSDDAAALDLRSYELLDRVGRGGMGEVFRGKDPALGRDLAVKVMRPELCGQPDAESRFRQEARVTGALQHPNIVPVHNLGRLPDGRLSFTMKLVRGRTLADMLAGARGAGRLPELLGVFEKVCQAVAFAHSRGVIHRDLKPANVMVGAFGEVQVMDWGLAKILQRHNGVGPDAGESGEGGDTLRCVWPAASTTDDRKTGIVGTPAYMPPEQARGETDDVDRRADVFGLGAILCEVLTGRPPYRGERSHDILRKAAAGDTADAFARLEECGADTELAILCRECLAAERLARPRDGQAVAERVLAYQTEVQERLKKAELERAAAEAREGEAKATAAAERKARRRTRALAAALLLLAAIGAGGGLLVQHEAGERQTLVEAALQKAAALRQQARWREAAAVLEQARGGLGDFWPGGARQKLDAAVADLALVNRLDAIRERRAMWVEGQFDYRTAARDYAATFREAGLGEVGDDEEAVAARVGASGVAGSLVAALDDWAFVAVVAREPKSAPWLLGVARRSAPDPWGNHFRDPDVWQDRQALQALADDALRDGGAKLDQLSPPVLISLGQLLGGGAEAVPLWRAAQRRYPSDFWLSLDLGHALEQAKQGEEALGYYRLAVALRPDNAAAHTNLGLALHHRQDLESALAEYRTAIALDPKLANAHNNLGNVLRAKSDLDGAIAEFRQAIDLDPKFALFHVNLGDALREKKDLAGAIAEFRQVIDLDPKFAPAHNNLGLALYDKHDLGGAIAEYLRAIELDPNYVAAHNNLGSALCDKKNLDGAIAEYRTAIDLDPKYALAHYGLGNALRDKKDLDGAIAAYHRAIDSARDYPEAHCNLGHVLRRQGRFAEALESLRRGHELGSKRRNWGYLSSQWVKDGERLLALDEKLSAVLGGEAEPADAAERIALAQLCQQYKGRHAATARFYADAFALAPQLAADLRQPHRYNAACSAALAAAGQGEDAKHLPDKVQWRLRRQALGWLRDDLAAYWKLMERDHAKAGEGVRQNLAYWQQDGDLASVRDKGALAKLPDDDSQQWRQLWDEVAALLSKVQEKK